MTKVGEFTRQITQSAMDNILDTFTGATTNYVHLCSLVRELDKRAAAGDEVAEKAIDHVIEFNRLIILAESLSKVRVVIVRKKGERTEKED